MSRTFKELCDGKVSNAIYALCDGLVEQDARPDFEVAMSTFGGAALTLCWGCAATCATQKLAGINLQVDSIRMEHLRARALDVDYRDLQDFEAAVNRFRMGQPRALCDYFGFDEEAPFKTIEGWRLEDDNWQEQLPLLREYADNLAKEGL